MTSRKRKGSGGSGRKSDDTLSLIPAPLRTALEATFEWAEKHEYEAALIGGVADCLYGSTRSTQDVDVLILTTDSPGAVYDTLATSGFEPRYTDTVEFAEASRTLLMRHQATSVPVDVILGMLPFDYESMEKSTVHAGTKADIRVYPVESLCVMKLIASREHDLRDVALLIETHPKLDRGWVLDQMTQFALAMEDPEALERTRQMLNV